MEKEVVELVKVIEKQKKIIPNTSKEKTKKFNLLRKLTRKLKLCNTRLSKDIVFGGLFNLRQITKFTNNKNVEKYNEFKNNYKNDRVLPLNLVGETHMSNSNRYFNFDLVNNKLTYKPGKGIKIEISFRDHKNKRKVLKKLQELKDSKTMPISIKLTKDNVFIIFDEQIINNYGFKKREWKEELNKLSKEDKQRRKDITISYYKEQEERMLKDKIKDRSISIDLNPDNIGCSICEFRNNELVVIDKWFYDLSFLTKKSNKSSSDKYSKYLNNKREFEICNIYKDIFIRATHYKCSIFGMEDLDFKTKADEEYSTESNRKRKNIWNRKLQEELIIKHCNILGIKLIKVNPCYSSFIGNMIYNYYDSINASIEIGRRALVQYKKGNSIFPEITELMKGTMSNRFFEKEFVRDDQEIKDVKSWISLYDYFKKNPEFKYRWTLDNFSKENYQCFRQKSTKSKVLLYTFN